MNCDWILYITSKLCVICSRPTLMCCTQCELHVHIVDVRTGDVSVESRPRPVFLFSELVSVSVLCLSLLLWVWISVP